MKFSATGIIKKLDERDPGIITDIWDHCFPMVHAMIRKHGGQKEDAEDTLQQALLAIILKMDSNELEITCSFRTFLMAVCRNIWKDTMKSKKHFKRYRERASLFTPVYHHHDNMDLERLMAIFQDICSRLGEKKKMALEMHLAGMPQKEIAGCLGISHAYTRKMVHDIKNEIKSLILDNPVAYRVVEEYIMNK